MSGLYNLLAATVLLTSACDSFPSGKEAAKAGGTRSDSAGSTIVLHEPGNPLPGSGVSARLSGTAVFSLDSIPRSSRSELFRITTAAFLDSGRIAIGHSSTSEVLLLEGDGRFVKAVGRDGSGPGEFRSVEGPWSVAGAKFAISDVRARRVTIFSSSGDIAQTVNYSDRPLPSTTAMFWETYGVTGSGTAVMKMTGMPASTTGVARIPLPIIVIDTVGSIRRVGPDIAGEEQLAMQTMGSGFAFLVSPLAAAPLVAACGNNIAVADNQSYSVSIMTMDGSVPFIVRAQVARHKVSDSDLLGASHESKGYGRSDSDLLAMYSGASAMELAPALHALHCDAAGALWVEEFADYARGQRRVIVYEPDGAIRSSFWLQVGMRILGVDRNRVMLAVTDDDGVEHLELRSVESSS